MGNLTSFTEAVESAVADIRERPRTYVKAGACLYGSMLLFEKAAQVLSTEEGGPRG